MTLKNYLAASVTAILLAGCGEPINSNDAPAWVTREAQTRSRLEKFDSELDNISEGNFYGFDVNTNDFRTAKYGDTVANFFGENAFNLIRSNASYQGLEDVFEKVNHTSNLQAGKSYRILTLE